MATQSSPTNLNELSETLYQRLVASGEWDRLARQLRKDLQASGWEDKLRSHAKDRVSQQSQPHLSHLIDDISPFAKETIPAEKRNEIATVLRKFVENEVEE